MRGKLVTWCTKKQYVLLVVVLKLNRAMSHNLTPKSMTHGSNM